MAIWDIVTKPLRGLGRLARGKFKEGFADIGGAARAAAPILGMTGIGLPAAALIGAGGGVLEAGASGEDLGGVLESGVKGAAGGAAGHGARGLLGIGRVAAGTAPAAAIPAGMPADVAAEAALNPELAAGMGMPAAPAATAAPSAAASTGAAWGKPAAPAPRGIGRQILAWAKENPELAVGVLGTAANVYGQQQMGEAQDRMLDLQERRMRPRRPYDEWAADRERMRGQYGYGGGG